MRGSRYKRKRETKAMTIGNYVCLFVCMEGGAKDVDSTPVTAEANCRRRWVETESFGVFCWPAAT